MSGWFEIDRAGMARVLERRGKSAALLELVQNAWDESGVTTVNVDLSPIYGKPLATFSVEDDAPAGFSDIGFAYTLFKTSAKAADPEKRGRFAIGEKLVFALCTEAKVETTKGTVSFDADGERREFPRRKRESGSVVSGTIRMTRTEVAETLAALHHLIPPDGIETRINGAALAQRTPLATFGAVLQTEIADDGGFLVRRYRHTNVDVYEPSEGETATLYEMGIPVVETGDRWHLDVRQKVPVSLDRAGLVSASYLRDVRAAALNATADLLTEADAAQTWVTDALEDPDVTAEAVNRTLDLRYGEKRVVYDPSDPEANRIAASKGYTVIPSRALSREAWTNVRSAEAALPAGRVTPSPKPFHSDGEPLKTVAPDDRTPAEQNLADYATELHELLVGRPLTVVLARDPGWKFVGAYGTGRLTINLSRLRGRGPCHEVDAFLIHEFAHSKGGHLTEKFDDAMAEIGAALAALCRDKPELFRAYERGARQ